MRIAQLSMVLAVFFAANRAAAATWLREDTDATIIMLGPFLDATDGVTAETGITAAAMEPNIMLSKAGGGFALRSETDDPAHSQTGWYTVPLDATDTSTPGKLIVKVHDSAVHMPVWTEFQVVPANVYDSLVGGSDKLQVDVDEWNNTAVPTEHTAGYPIVTIKDGVGTGEISTEDGIVAANVTHIAGSSQPANNAQMFFNGTGYGVHVREGQFNGAATGNIIEFVGANPWDDYTGCEVIITRYSDHDQRLVRTITNLYQQGVFVLDQEVTVANGDKWVVVAGSPMRRAILSVEEANPCGRKLSKEQRCGPVCENGLVWQFCGRVGWTDRSSTSQTQNGVTPRWQNDMGLANKNDWRNKRPSAKPSAGNWLCEIHLIPPCD
jgi:hypothetical protein